MTEEKKITNEELAAAFIEDLNFLSDKRNLQIVFECAISPVTAQLSADRKLYESEQKKTMLSQQMRSKLSAISDPRDLKKLIEICLSYLQSPFGIFKSITELEASDIFITYDRVNYTKDNDQAATSIVVPPTAVAAYNQLIDFFISLSMYSSNIDKTKFDPGNAILDYTSDGIRFNVSHGSLAATGYERPIIAIRKQILRTEQAKSFDHKQYIKDIGLDQTQLAFIGEMATKGTIFVFGETGSGKTTLMKFIANIDLNKKRNLVTIEDTPELFLPVSIAYLTNDRYSISDLFKVALRENPSHMIIGESRSSEICDILESATVFPCMTSFHADSLFKCITRMVFTVKGDRPAFSTQDINMLITSTVDCFIHMRNRKVVAIYKRRDRGGAPYDFNDASNNYVEVKDEISKGKTTVESFQHQQPMQAQPQPA